MLSKIFSLKSAWWKVLCALFLLYTVVGGLLMPVPLLDRGNLEHTIRNLYFHVPMWFGMIALYTASFWQAIKHLRRLDEQSDMRSQQYAVVGTFFGILGTVTGAEWAYYTWGEAWSNDPKQLGTAIFLLTYFAYFILRGGIPDSEKRGRIAAVYNIFAFAMMVPLLFVMPRMVDSLHPGNGGNPAFSNYDLDSQMRRVFYPAVLGWILMGFWIASLCIRMATVRMRRHQAEAQRHSTTTEASIFSA